RNRQWRDRGRSEIKRTGNHMRLGFEISRKWIQAFERKFVDSLQVTHGCGRGIDRHTTAGVGKPAEVIKNHDVVSMRMSKDDSIYTPNVLAQSLGAKVGACVDNECTFRRFDVNGRAQPLVAWIGRSTNLAIATNHRHTLRSSGPEKGKLKV